MIGVSNAVCNTVSVKVSLAKEYRCDDSLTGASVPGAKGAAARCDRIPAAASPSRSEGTLHASVSCRASRCRIRSSPAYGQSLSGTVTVSLASYANATLWTRSPCRCDSRSDVSAYRVRVQSASSHVASRTFIGGRYRNLSIPVSSGPSPSGSSLKRSASVPSPAPRPVLADQLRYAAENVVHP